MDNSAKLDLDFADKAESYIADLHSENKQTRERAYDALKVIGPDRILGQLLEANGSALQECNTIWRSRAMITSVAIGVSGYLLFSSLSACNKDPYGSVGSFLFAVLCTGLSGLFFLFRKPSSGSQYRQRSLLKLLCLSNDPRCIGAFCDYLGSSVLRKRNFDLNHRVVGALARLLPSVEEGVGEPLSAQQRAVLCAELRRISWTDYNNEPDVVSDTDAKLAVAIIRFVETRGDLGAIRDLERLCFGTDVPNVWIGVKEQANKSLAALRKLQSAENQGKALLRGSEKPQTEAAELLRQAKSPEADPQELLRPGNHDDASHDE